MYRVNRYRRRGVWRWRVWKGPSLLARSAKTYRDARVMERELRSLFPHWVKA